jgi:hypothetical protein
MEYVHVDELSSRLYRRWSKLGYVDMGPISIHKNTNCRVSGFVGIGPMYTADVGSAWFDIRCKVGSLNWFELDDKVAEACRRVGLPYQRVQR